MHAVVCPKAGWHMEEVRDKKEMRDFEVVFLNYLSTKSIVHCTVSDAMDASTRF